MTRRPKAPAAVAALAWLLPALPPGPARADDWPQLQKDAGHTGCTPDEPRPPFRIRWARNLGEPAHTGAPPSVAAGKVFVGTNWGNVLALDRETGATAWSYRTAAPVLGTPAYMNTRGGSGIVYVNSMDRRCHAVRAEDGGRVWTFETGEGIWAAPVLAEGKVFVAGRDGFVYALEAEAGKLVWKSPTNLADGGIVMAAPAYDEGVLHVGAGDNRVYAFRASDGKELWRSGKLPGMAIRDYWLVASGGSVVVTTQLVYSAHGTYEHMEKAFMREFRERNDGKMLVQDELLAKVGEWYGTHPHQ